MGGWLSGRAPPSHGGGRRFEPCSAHHVSARLIVTASYGQKGRDTGWRLDFSQNGLYSFGTGSWCSWSNTLACHAGDHGFKSRRSRQSGSSSGVERCLAKAVVAGPNPVFRSIFICSSDRWLIQAGVAQLVEQLIRNQQVVCSNQIAGSIVCRTSLSKSNAGGTPA